jgi:hypothetical protein
MRWLLALVMEARSSAGRPVTIGQITRTRPKAICHIPIQVPSFLQVEQTGRLQRIALARNMCPWPLSRALRLPQPS